jgi:hypothetical protein
MRAVVIAIKENRAAIAYENGVMSYIDNDDFEPGQILELPEIAETEAEDIVTIKPKTRAISHFGSRLVRSLPNLAAAVLLLFFVGGVTASAAPAYTVTVDSGKRYVLSVNMFDRVIATDSEESSELQFKELSEAFERILLTDKRETDGRDRIVTANVEAAGAITEKSAKSAVTLLDETTRQLNEESVGAKILLNITDEPPHMPEEKETTFEDNNSTDIQPASDENGSSDNSKATPGSDSTPDNDEWKQSPPPPAAENQETGNAPSGDNMAPGTVPDSAPYQGGDSDQEFAPPQGKEGNQRSAPPSENGQKPSNALPQDNGSKPGATQPQDNNEAPGSIPPPNDDIAPGTSPGSVPPPPDDHFNPETATPESVPPQGDNSGQDNTPQANDASEPGDYRQHESINQGDMDSPLPQPDASFTPGMYPPDDRPAPPQDGVPDGGHLPPPPEYH